MTRITFDDEGNATIQMNNEDVGPFSTEAYMCSLEKHLIDYSMVRLVTVEAMNRNSGMGAANYRQALLDSAGKLPGLVKITDYTTTMLFPNHMNNQLRLAGTGIVLDLGDLKKLYSAFKQLESLPDSTKDSGATDDSFDLLI